MDAPAAVEGTAPPEPERVGPPVRGGAAPFRRPGERRRPPWRKWVRLVHRDVGYLAAGLTVVYALSGIAVNHRADWNPNYQVRQESVAFSGPAPGTVGPPGSDAWARGALEALGVSARYRGTFLRDDATVEIFVDGGMVTVEPGGSRATLELVRPRPLLRPANFLHLNEARRLWTWVADVYAAALLILALTGLFVLRGRTGITGRGAWLTLLGVAVPALFLVLYF